MSLAQRVPGQAADNNIAMKLEFYDDEIKAWMGSVFYANVGVNGTDSACLLVSNTIYTGLQKWAGDVNNSLSTLIVPRITVILYLCCPIICAPSKV